MKPKPVSVDGHSKLSCIQMVKKTFKYTIYIRLTDRAVADHLSFFLQKTFGMYVCTLQGFMSAVTPMAVEVTSEVSPAVTQYVCGDAQNNGFLSVGSGRMWLLKGSILAINTGFWQRLHPARVPDNSSRRQDYCGGHCWNALPSELVNVKWSSEFH